MTAEAEARRAIDLAPDNARYHDTLAGCPLGKRLGWMTPRLAARRAIELAPDNAGLPRLRWPAFSDRPVGWSTPRQRPAA